MTRQLLSRHKKRIRALIWLAFFGLYHAVDAAETSIEITFLDKTTGEKIASRVEFTKPFSKAPRPRNALVAGRHMLVEGTAKFTPAPGAYEFMVRRGPEFLEVRSGFELERNAQDAFEVVVPHKVPMRSEGWYSGDLLSPIAPELLSRWMRADDLDVVATTFEAERREPSGEVQVDSVKNLDGSRLSTKEVDRIESLSPGKGALQALNYVQQKSHWFNQPGQGGVLIHRLDEQTLDPETISSFALLDRLDSRDSCFIELTRPWERDVPVLLATEKIDSIQLLSTHLLPDTALPLTASVRNPDSLRFKGKKGLARLSEHLYWQMLEAGFRLPPTAEIGRASCRERV